MENKKSDANLKVVSSKQLVVDLKNLVGKEREILSQILNYLREVEARRLFIPMGYSSLFDFCTRELGYSSDQAYRRICAVRLVREVPEAEEKIDSGALALSSAAELYRFMSAQKKLSKSPTASESGKAIPAVIDLLNYACENSKQALQQKLLETAEKTGVQKYIARETVKPVTSDLTELKIMLPSAVLKKMKMLQDSYSNKLKDGGVGKLFEFLIEAEIERIEKLKLKSLKLAEKSNAKTENVTLSAKGMARYNQVGDLNYMGEVKLQPLYKLNLEAHHFRGPCEQVGRDDLKKEPQILHKQNLSRSLVGSRYISVHDKRFIRARDQGRCQHRGCKATRYLHFDHVVPLSLGGKTSVENLQLLCAAHNIYKGAHIAH